MFFFLRSLFFGIISIIMGLSAVVFAFTLNANVISQKDIYLFSGMYILALSLLISYPLFQLYALFEKIHIAKRDNYEGSILRIPGKK